jgi:GT2 family glycosyltransferase
MNPVIVLTHNCLELTKKCVESIHAQDIETSIWVLDNNSTDGTREWMQDKDNWEHLNLRWMGWDQNRGVSFAWNYGLTNNGYFTNHCLVLNNDTEIPPWFYSSLLGLNLPFVTGVSVDDWREHPSAWPQLAESPDFSAFLIRRDAWEKIGPFDETMKHYASDIDYHLRAKELGIPLMNAGVPFTHKRSSTILNASPVDRRLIELQADLDRDAFRRKWGDKHPL